MLYGIYDTKDNCWLGDDTGPKTFEDYTLARIAAQMAEDQVFSNRGMGLRFQAKEYKVKNLRYKDSLDTKRTALEALNRLEGD